MDILFLSSVWIITLLTDSIHCNLKPLVALYDNLPPMYMTNNGWVVNQEYTIELTNMKQIVNFCNFTYPDYDIINAVPLFKTEEIKNWCLLNQTCTANDKHVIHPIECINSNYTYRPISIAAYCKFNVEHEKRCLSFKEWKKLAKTKCDSNDQNLKDLQVIFPCKDEYMLFREVEYVCCSNPDERYLYSSNLRLKLNDIVKSYESSLRRYRKKSNFEHDIFSSTKHSLVQSHTRSLTALYVETKENLTIIIKGDPNLNSTRYKTAELELFEIFKSNYKALAHDFKKRLFQLDNMHIERVIEKSGGKCINKNNTDNELSTCLRELTNMSKRIMAHFKLMIELPDIDRHEYLSFIESHLKHLYKKYLPFTRNRKDWSEKFYEQLQSYRLKLEALTVSGNKMMEYVIKRKFNHCKKEVKRSLVSKYQSKDGAANRNNHYLTLAPMIGIITIVIFVFVAALSALVYKYYSNPFRRGTHNYVMRVVSDPSHTSHGTTAPEMKLNLYENPVFNSKSSSKQMEKRSLIENMDN